MTTLRPFAQFDPAAPAGRVHEGRAARLRSDAALAYLGLMPGFAFARQRSGFVHGWHAMAPDAPALGSWMMLPDLTTPATQTVLPMNDSLYGACHIELDRQGPQVLRIPADPDERYFSVAVLDGWFTNVAHLGPKWSGRGAVEALLVPPGWAGQPPAGMRVIELPTASACLLARVLVRYEPGDLDRVRQWREGISLTPLDAMLAPVSTDDLVHPDIAAMDNPTEYFTLMTGHLARNPLPAEMAWLGDTVDLAGLLEAAQDTALRGAVIAGVEDAQAMIDATLTTWPTRRGWRVPPSWVGLPTAHVVENAALQLFQVGSNDREEAVYYFCGTDEAGSVLDGSHDAVYELAFPAGEAPPVDDDGFWSLTMYGPDNLLVENPLGRYSTRPSRPGFELRGDGAVVVTLAAALPEGASEANWLPAPAGPFQVGLRVYYPREGAANGTWFPPAVRRVR